MLAGWALASENPLLTAIARSCHLYGRPGTRNGPRAELSHSGHVVGYKAEGVSPEEWAWVFSHLFLHLGLGHFREMAHPRAWQAACDLFVVQFLSDLKIAKNSSLLRPERITASEEELYKQFVREGIPDDVLTLSVGGADGDMNLSLEHGWVHPWTNLLAQGLQAAVENAVVEASGVSATRRNISTPAQRARSWFMANYPLLGGLAAGMEIIEDADLCHRMGIQVAAVNAEDRTVYFNPHAGLDDAELRFVFAHELLHVGLNHHCRHMGRDPYLWNVACDFAINHWLIEMGVGSMPKVGGLYDPELKNLSAEEIYHRIATDLRRYRKLLTFRGIGLGDILGEPKGGGSETGLDEWYRSALQQGLDLAQRHGRGLIPAHLIEEIRALAAPPIPWDVRLAQWLDHHFAPLERQRSFARPSRRQSATPDMPRPRWITPEVPVVQRTFGVVLDTSGSMDGKILGSGLGAIASYAASRDVAAVRVVFCDAAAYDAGYMAVQDIAGSVKVKGRGGTVLQPGIDLLVHAPDFPKDGPILVITDGYCDRFTVPRSHAVMIPPGARLPFWPQCPVFEMKEQ